jgi:hypothetical protein
MSQDFKRRNRLAAEANCVLAGMTERTMFVWRTAIRNVERTQPRGLSRVNRFG